MTENQNTSQNKNSFLQKIPFLTNLKQLFSDENGTRWPFSKRVTLVIAGVMLIGLLLLTVYIIFPGVDPSVPLYKVRKDKFLVTITESGELIAKNAVSVSSPRVRGNLKIVYLIPEGSYVQPGDTVVQFDPTEALNNLREAESRLEVAISNKEKLVANQLSQMTRLESDLKSAELSYELSKLSLEQMKFEAEIKQQEGQLQLKRNELSFLKAKQDLASQKIVQKSELNNVEIDVQQKRTDLQRAERDLQMLTLSAPKEGLVVYENNWATGRKIAIGDTPWQGMTIITLPDLSEMQSVTYVNEVDVSRIRKELNVEVRLDAFRDSSFPGYIASVAALGKAKDGNSAIKVFEIAVNIRMQSEILKPGMTTSNRIIISEVPDVLYIPQEAVFQKHGGHVVYIKRATGFEEKDVTLGERNEDYIIVTKGLRTGDEVALRDPTIKEDEPLQPAAEKTSASNGND
ncbi:MAG: efflux RND transporter periplasmic adaptor subunit [Ignavibacteriaceae bacterium]|nr:efflux RND transporter periplasmic adaptor subunit [Ignavibacteriaceae bacterium]